MRQHSGWQNDCNTDELTAPPPMSLLRAIASLVAILGIALASIFLCVWVFEKDVGEVVGGVISSAWMVIWMPAFVLWRGHEFRELFVITVQVWSEAFNLIGKLIDHAKRFVSKG